ncbi:MAG: glycosyltransferase [Thermodesulfobacteriota bacterium]
MSGVKKVLYIFATLPIGGAEEHLRTVVANLEPCGFTPMVCCIGEKGIIGEEIEALGVEVTALGRMKGKGFDPRIIKELMALMKDKKIEIVHTHLYHANMYGRAAALACKIPVVATEHNVYKSYKRKRSIINRLLAKKTDRIIAVSGAVSDYICSRDSIDPAKVEVIYNGIEVDRFRVPTDEEKNKARVELGFDSSQTILGTVSRLSKQKGHTYLLKAMVSLSKSYPDLKLLIVGSGPLDSVLKAEAKELGLLGSVEFLGARRDIPVILEVLDLFVMPSLWEGFPVSLLEAFATGLSVVASNVGGVADAVEDRVSGMLVEPTDVDGLTDSISAVLNDKELRRKLGTNAREVVEERFSVSGMVGSLAKLYDDVLARRGRA